MLGEATTVYMYMRLSNIIKPTIVIQFNVLVVLLFTMSNAYISTWFAVPGSVQAMYTM